MLLSARPHQARTRMEGQRAVLFGIAAEAPTGVAAPKLAATGNKPSWWMGTIKIDLHTLLVIFY